MVISEWIGKDLKGSDHGITVRYYLSICLERLKKSHEKHVKIASLCTEN
jgi:hypothetical protein